MSGYEQNLKKSNPDFDRLQKLKKRPTESTTKGNTILSRNPRFLEKTCYTKLAYKVLDAKSSC